MIWTRTLPVAAASAALFAGLLPWLGNGMQLISQVSAQRPVPAAPLALGGRSIPDVTQAQAIALVQMDAGLRPLIQNVTVMRAALTAATFLEPANDLATKTAVSNVEAAELALAMARNAAFKQLQRTPNRLEHNQVLAFGAMGATSVSGGGGRRGTAPDFSKEQTTILGQMNAELRPLVQAQAAASSKLAQESLSAQNAASVRASAGDLRDAELALAMARAGAFAKLQASSERLSPAQLATFVTLGDTLNAARPGGAAALNGPTALEPLNFNDHLGYVSLFDGVSLKGWDGNPKFWHVENGEIVGEATPANPSGNTYIVYRASQAHDFTLKLELKDDNTGGTGIQYRSQIGLPWTAAVPLTVTANAGPTNPNWMMTGPQADFWPSTDPLSRYTGQFYSENDPMRIMAARGNVVEGFGLGPKRLVGSIADPTTLYTNTVKATGWNEYTIIARGGTFIHIINGQLMSVMVDDDPDSLNNKSGYIGIELEANARIHVKNIWLKKLN